MRLTYYGHASFLVETGVGTRVILDPYAPDCYDGALRYDAITDPADVVIATHEHPDHCGVDTIPGSPRVLIRPTAETIDGLRVIGVPAAHDDTGGSERGSNTMVVLDDGDVRLAHLGDLGHLLDATAVEALGRVDILLIPVGGHFTIDHKDAERVVAALSPKVVVPMHFKTEKIDFPIAGIDPFLVGQGRVEQSGASAVEFTAATLPSERTVVVLKPSK